MVVEPLHPENKVAYVDGDRVQFTIDGDVARLYVGTVIGILSRQIIDHWIVLLDEPIPEWPYRSVAVQHTFIRKLGSNEPFLCEGRNRLSGDVY